MLPVGKQTRFFMSEADELGFLGVARDRRDVILDVKGRELDIDDVGARGEFKVYLAQPDLGLVVRRPSGYVEDGESEVVEFVRCRQLADDTIGDGRIWAVFRYYDASDQPVSKSKEFEAMYSFYARWVKKHYRINRDKDYYIGPDAYRKYKEDGWVMRSGVVTLEFD
jgi:hypothetical protein